MASILFVAGARPNFMKIAPILRAFEGRASGLRDVLVHTGQHYDDAMSKVFFKQLGMREPDEHLQVGSGSHAAQTARIMTAFEEFLNRSEERPSAVVVVGDVNSTMACTLVATKLHIPVVHVEAGLRSGDRRMPEEINRLVTDSVADWLLVSEPDGMRNLKAEGVPDSRVVYVGNVMIDSLVHQLEAARETRMAASLGLEGQDYALVTLHRPSNVDGEQRLADCVGFLRRLAERLPVVFPVHPRTKKNLQKYVLYDELDSAPGMHLLDPLGYRELVGLMASAKLVVSDSGGIQEETSFLQVPCITLRPSTERPVTVTEGTNTIVGEDLELAWTTALDILGGQYKSGKAIDGWDGKAAERVVDHLVAHFG